ncbi:DNA-dependent protein kinase catalytic subunit [Thraustotheca clavata]|uniref:DNA-dependent protein kinase catalytic subunit n=1 Tax=Thraustotheca clavata TaxID=74557 RepID=A0A1V9ZL93_9STRA|nr:DNA-dependent protein kinase catalytic subunit [Thraustotheca clavata]
MKLADETSAMYFPRVLDLVQVHSDHLQYLNEAIVDVPVWTLLHWSAQIIALLKPSSTLFNDFIIKILESMAEVYPLALYYDYNLTPATTKASPRLNRLSALLKDPSLDRFIAALNGLHHPEIRFKEGIRVLMDAIEGQPAVTIKTMVAAFLDNVLDNDVTRKNDIGEYNRSWSRKHRKEIEKMLSTPVTKASLTQARAWIAKTFQVAPGRCGINRQWKAKLSDFSEWLATFDSIKTRIELPGQYTSRWCKPEPSKHTTILSFDPQLLVLASKQLPKRLALHANNGQTYLFLVKGGEDLRLDQRIEQLFGVVNTILQGHPGCQRRRELSIRTYKVIPMTATIGLVEWLDNTKTLKSIVEDEMQSPSAKKSFQLLSSPSGEQYEAFWSKQKSKLPYGHKIASVTAKDVVPAFLASQELLPKELFRNRLLRMASAPEDFFTLRSTFQSSLSAFNGAAYLLGIGDRHLDNFLMDQTTASVIGIDFGISFGAGASLLPVPELVPFRFTQQLQGALLPYDGKVLLQQDLSIVLEAIRESSQRLDSIMNVFLNEPVVEWQVMKKAKATKKDKQQSSTESMAQVKMRHARLKISGIHPKHIVLEELQLNSHVASVLPAFKQLLSCESNPTIVLSPLDQAKALIELATDPNVLGRMFHGWSPWA